MPKGRFEDPPINEVVCGVLFEQVDEIDPVLAGAFWETRTTDFPRKQVEPALLNVAADGELVVDFGPVPPLRTWLISANDEFVVQIQRDRFYVNWRARGAAYPSFNAADGREGLRSKVLTLFNAFREFSEKKVGKPLNPVSVEMSMIDVLKQDRHWRSVDDLALVLPSLSPFLGEGSIPTGLSIRVERAREPGTLVVAMQLARARATGAPAIRLDTTRRMPLGAGVDVETRLSQAHDDLKTVFDMLIPEEQHHRFSKTWRPTS